ncbi:hypothetical protein [Baaleninema simplex]|uniref:hypothetical protein n=1 Tax=Baaleninema simplex TaxID=2862350 RepID=UPI00178C1FEB|nr:hypothetical protein [Baaleninema simplex]
MYCPSQRGKIHQRTSKTNNSGTKKNAKAYGRKYAELDVASCFAPLLKWVLELLGESDDLFLALDATHIGQKFIRLVTQRTLSRQWHSRGLENRESFPETPLERPCRQDLLRRLSGVVPESVRVWVLADRGLYACWLYEEIVALGWHPLLRINSQGYYQVRSGETLADWQPLEQVVRVGESFSQPVTLLSPKFSRLYPVSPMGRGLQRPLAVAE